ncbi:MAG: hypothetical protein BWK76_03905 [Desulfobulbaceae bacterium A2]|nr:MAG: hypothetical protein BWK76_03905 [Desulfobulbaceae bacterium A2]
MPWLQVVFPRWFFRLTLLWTVFVAALLLAGILRMRGTMLEQVRVQLRASIAQDLVYRHWAAVHGGVYVPVTEETPPNPALSHLKERDISTPSGRPLTLMNPAYMTRQVHELVRKSTGLHSHLTSLRPIRQANEADEWERRALEQFEQRVPEVSEILTEDGEPVLRLMLPLLVEAPCLKCHAQQGYREGEIRGGLSVTRPLSGILALWQREYRAEMLRMLLLWAVGLLGLFWTLRANDRNLAREQRATRRARDAEERLRALINAVPDIVCFKDGDGRWLEANTADIELFRLQGVDYRGRTDSELAEFTDPLYREAFLACEASDAASWNAGAVTRGDERIPLPEGGSKVYDVIKVPLFESDGRRKGLVVFGRDITERQRAEDELAQRRLLQDSLFDAIPDLIFYKDCQGVYLGCNKAFEEYAGRPAEELTGRSDLDLFPPEVAEFFRAQDRLALAGGVLRRNEEWVDYPDGRHVLLETAKAPFFGPDGQAAGLLGISRDITERQQIADRLRENEHFLRRVLDSIQDGIIVIDLRLHIIMSNRTMEQWYAEFMPLVGRSCHDVCRQKLCACPDCAIELMLRDGRPQRQLVSFTDAGGRTRHQERSVYPTLDARNQIQGAIVFIRDITEQRRAEGVQRQLAAAVEQAADVVIITDTAGLVEYVNPAFEQLSGYALAEIRGRGIEIVRDEHPETEAQRQVWETISAGAVWQGHFINRRKDGGRYEVEATISPIRDDEGRIVSFVSVQHDVSQEKELRSQLQAAQKIESLGVLAGGVAHDFNNMLGAIQGYTEMAMMELDHLHPLYGKLSQVLQAAERAGGVVRQLLLFSRRQAMEKVPVDLNSLVRNFLKMLGRLIGEDIRIADELAPGLWSVSADPGTIEQVVMNLAVNARDAMPDGGTLSIATANVLVDAEYCAQHVLARPGRFVRLTVADCGCGMGDETLAHIFEPFFTTKQAGKGTGLGLAVVYGIVKEHRGWITVASSPGSGTLFEVYLPATAAAVSLDTQEDRDDLSGCRGRGELILLVEDDRQVRDMVVMLLKTTGYQILAAASAAEARQQFETAEQPVRLLLSDVILPDISGLQLAEELLEQHPQLPVILCSGYTGEKAQETMIRARGFVFLPKPYQLPELLRQVRRLLDEA